MTNFDPTALSDEEQQGLRTLLAAIPETDDTEPPDRYTTSNGIVLQLKPIPPLLINDAQNNLKAPRPPRVPNLDKDPDGHVLEENPNDPTFIEQYREYRVNLSELSNAIFLTRGTKVLDVPSGVEPVDSTDWSDDLKDLAGLDVPEKGRRRYYCWMKYVALSNINDLTTVLRKVSNLAGVTLEADVAQATADFPSGTEGNTPTPIRAATEDGRGDNDIPERSGPSAGVRVQGDSGLRALDLDGVAPADGAGTS